MTEALGYAQDEKRFKIGGPQSTQNSLRRETSRRISGIGDCSQDSSRATTLVLAKAALDATLFGEERERCFPFDRRTTLKEGGGSHVI